MTTLTLSKALNAGLRKALENDPKVLIMGEDVGKLGGVFRVTDGLWKDFGENRVIDTPLAESGIVGTAIGLARRGYRPVCEIQFDGFVYPATDQIVSQLAKMRYRSRGRIALPIVIRIPFAAAFARSSITSETHKMFFEPKRRYGDKAEVDMTAPLGDALPLDKARVVQQGDDVTLLSYGPLVRT